MRSVTSRLDGHIADKLAWRPLASTRIVRQPRWAAERSRSGSRACTRPPRTLATALATIVFVLSGCGSHSRSGAPSSDPVLVSFPNTDTGIHLGLAFDHLPSGELAPTREVNYVFGGGFVDWQVKIDPAVAHSDVYLPFASDSYPQNVPGHSLKDWQTKHPNWIVYHCDGKTPAYYGSGYTNVPLDFTNPAVRAYEVREAAAALARGAAGIAFDNFTFSNYEGRCGVYRNGIWTKLGYPATLQQNPKYVTDMMDWLRSIRSALRKSYPRASLALNINFAASGLVNVERAAPYVDMVYNESGFTSYGTQDLTGVAWQQEVDALEYLNHVGKAFVVSGIVDASADSDVTPGQINWVLSNYLLVKGAHSYTYVYARGDSATGPTGYGTFYDRAQYHAPIGHPVSGREQDDGLQLRRYSGGLAIVNPSPSHSYTIRLGSKYRDMFGRTYESVTLTPASAIVLLAVR